MTAPGNDVLVLVLTLSVVVSSAYAIGRIHQWNKHGTERDEAFRHGYDQASLSIFNMMSRHGPPAPVRAPIGTPPAARSCVPAGRRPVRGPRSRGR